MLAWLKKRLSKRRKIPKLYRGVQKFKDIYPHFEIGVGSYGIPKVHDWSQGTKLSIGAYTSIADDVHVFLGGHHRTDWLSSFPFPAFVPEADRIEGFVGTNGDVRIGNDVWLASGCTVLSGVSIGNGAVVAARSVVTRDVAPYAIVAGNPARFLRWRFDEATRRILEQSAWWAWPESEVKEVIPLLCSSDIQGFADYCARRANA